MAVDEETVSLLFPRKLVGRGLCSPRFTIRVILSVANHLLIPQHPFKIFFASLRMTRVFKLPIVGTGVLDGPSTTTN